MKKKAMWILILLQMMTLSACGKAADETPLGTDSIQVEKSEIGEEEITVVQEEEKKGEDTMEQGEKADRIPDTPLQIPEEYYSLASEQGTLERSRDHRAFCGFSMGSVTTWHTFEYCLPYFRYFLPSSGDLTSDGQYMERIVTGSGYGPKDFFIYAMSGTRDFDYSAFSRQIQAMLEAPGGIFIEADNEEDGNLAYRVQEGNEHNGEAAMQYIYNGLVWLWKTDK